jgi:hypothetical protein
MRHQEGKAPMRTRLIATIVALAGFVLMVTSPSARAEGDLLVWCIAHARMEAKWQASEPKCGWTVAGYTCGRKRHVYAATK